MIIKVRKYIISRVVDGRINGSVIQESDLSIEEMILAICLMTYYLMTRKDVYNECLEFFRNRIESVNEVIMARCENNTDADSTVEMSLAEVFLDRVRTYVYGAEVESDMIPAAKRLYNEFFSGAEEIDNESLDDEG